MDLYKEIQEQRVKMWHADRTRDAHVDVQPEDIQQYCDLSYGSDAMHRFDVYVKKDVPLPLPVIINVHGGGWYYGDKTIYKAYCLRLAKQGYCVVNFNYRLAPEHPYPAALDDIDRLCHYIATTIHRYGGDTQRVYVVADSAGAELALQYVTLQMSETFHKQFSYEPLPYSFRKVALYCGVYFLETSPTMITGRLKHLRHAYLPDAIWEQYRDQLNPEPWMKETAIQWLLATGQDDFLRDDTVNLHQFLDRHHVSHHFYDYHSDAESVRHVFELHPDTAVATEALCDLMTFFNEV